MLSTMLALIPIALNTWRILRAQKPKVFHAIQPHTKKLTEGTNRGRHLTLYRSTPAGLRT